MKYAALVLFLLWFGAAEAQTCTGGLGDPIVNISFGQGSGPGPALPAGITSLGWLAGGCPTDGQYAIVSSTSDCWGGTWLTLPHDHTGDEGGYFMLINASYAPSDFYVKTIDGLCGGTTYQFAAWVMNMAVRSNQIKPNITFRIEQTDGTVLKSFSTGDMPAVGYPLWVQYPFYFDTPTGVSTVVIRMINNAPGGTGNDLALDDITFRAAGPSIKTITAGFNGDTLSLCEGDPQVLHFSSTVESCFASAVYQWQVSTDGGTIWKDIPGAVGRSFDRPASLAGSYLYRMTVAESGNAGIASCSVASLPVLVNVVKLPAPAVSISTGFSSVCTGAPAVFLARAVDGGSTPLFQWRVNGADVAGGILDSVFVTAALRSTDVVSCMMTSNAVCVVDPFVLSHGLSIAIIPIPVTGVDIVVSADKICADSVVSFTASPVNGGAAPGYFWKVNGIVVDSSGALYTTGALKDGDVVSCAMTGSLTCSRPVEASEAIHMTVYPLPTIVPAPDTIIAGGAGIRLSPVFSGDIVDYQWSPATGLDDPALARPVAAPVSTTSYQLKVVTAEGCRALAVTKVRVFYDVQLPGAFTPNGDGHNDLFRVPPVITVHIRRLAVYNRQGVMVFLTEDMGKGWDGRLGGKLQPAGVYVWMVEYDNPLTKKIEMKKGTVVLVR
jgi:gliding motility-associated-like protein